MPLAGAVPSPAGYSLAGLPRALEPGQVQAMLASRDPATATGRRDRAVLLLLSRMGLRAGELAGLGLHDIDWRRGEITVRGKGGRRDRLPLPADVGGASTITTEDALAWATLPAGTSPAWQAIWLAAVRGFAAYLHGTDPSVQVPRPGLIGRGNDRATPYLHSGTEISAIIAAAGTLRPRFRAATYQALISLLAVSGIRIGEAFALDSNDLDADDGVLIVRDSKFGKTSLSRCIPARPPR